MYLFMFLSIQLACEKVYEWVWGKHALWQTSLAPTSLPSTSASSTTAADID